jgi:hypothetical protein
MNEELFVERLRLLAPLREDLQKHDIPDDYIQQLINSYQCSLKSKSGFLSTDNVLLSLLNYYDCSNVEIGTVKLLESPIEESGFYEVGKVDIDILALNKITLQIEVLDHDAPEHVIWLCASNSSNFLEALLLSAEYLTSKLKNLSDEQDPPTLLKYVKRCAETAGGVQYVDFYKMLLGYFE